MSTHAVSRGRQGAKKSGRAATRLAFEGRFVAPFKAWFERWLRPVVDLFPLTSVGLVVLGCSLVALLYYGLRRIDLILLVVGAVGTALVALAVLTTVVGALVAWRSVRHRPTDELGKLECGYPSRTGFWLPYLWYVPLVDVRWIWIHPEAQVRTRRSGARLFEEVIASRRGEVREVVRRFEVGDIFGLCQIRFWVGERRPVRFAPSRGNLQHIEIVRGMSGGDELSHPEGPTSGDPYDLRRYQAGDPIKLMLWKVFARTRMAVVRTPERAISPARKTVAYLVTGDLDEPAAGAARVAAENGSLGEDWVLGADGSGDVAMTPAQAVDILTRSGHARPEAGGAGLGEFFARASTGSVGRTVVFVPGTPGPWIDKVKAACSGHRGRVEFVVGIDGLEQGPEQSWWRSLLTGESRPRHGAGSVDPVRIGELNEVIEGIGGGRSKVVVVDRVDGRLYTPGHLEGMRPTATKKADLARARRKQKRERDEQAPEVPAHV